MEELREAIREFFEVRGYRFNVGPLACIESAIRSANLAGKTW